MTTTTTADVGADARQGSGQRPSAEARHLKRFYVHMPRQLTVRLSRGNLCDSVSHTLLRRVLEVMCETLNDTSFNVSQTHGLGAAAERRYAAFAFGEELLRWSEGDSKPQLLGHLVQTARANQGLLAGRERLAALRGSFFSTTRRREAARNMAEELFAAGQRRAGPSVAALQALLEQAVAQLERLCEAASRDAAGVEARRAQLEEAVREASLAVARRLTDEAGEEDAGGGFWQRVKRGLGAAARAVSRGAGRLNQGGSSQADAADWASHADAAEAELLDCEIRLAARSAEWEVLTGVVEALTYEGESNRALLALLGARRDAAAPAAAQAERVRDYGLAGGELLLNDAALTRAVISDMFPSDVVAGAPLGRFLTLCAREIEQASVPYDAALVERMFEAVRAEVRGALRGFTAADAVVALQRDNPHFAARLRAAFEAIARPDFLAPGYERSLDLQRFASLTYVAPATREANVGFRSMLNDLLIDVHVNAQVKAVETEPETLRFCVVDYVPLTMLGLYREALPAYEGLKNNPRYNVHPELSA